MYRVFPTSWHNQSVYESTYKNKSKRIKFSIWHFPKKYSFLFHFQKNGIKHIRKFEYVSLKIFKFDFLENEASYKKNFVLYFLFIFARKMNLLLIILSCHVYN